MIGFVIGRILLTEAVLLVLPMVVAVAYGEAALPFLIPALLLAVIGLALGLKAPKRSNLYARDGFAVVALAWVLMSVFGALPFVLSGDIPHFVDAFFETVSGFTTTGASILTEIEPLGRGVLFWRSFTHWVGGMGVLVFVMAILPLSSGDGHGMHLMRAEVPGPSVGKLVSRMGDTAKILYGIYLVMTVIEIVLLLLGGMPLFDACIHAFGTAGTGGFGIKNDSMGSYSPYLQNVTTIFMILFGVNFSCYYLLLLGQFKSVWKDEELRTYVGIILLSIALIVPNIRGMFDSLAETIRHAAFQVGSIITTTGFSTVDFDQWPSFSKAILMLLMIVGACAGSTGGGLKVARLLLILKSLRRNIRQMLNPRKVQVIRNNDSAVDEKVLANTNAYLAAYVVISFVIFGIISLDGFSIGTNFSAVLCTFNNIGPGFEAVGPMCNFAAYSPLSKFVLSLGMLAGRLEIFPILVLLSRSTWKR